MAVEHTIITKDGHRTVKLTRAKAIRQKCLDCCGWYTPEIRMCECEDCALWPFRMGGKPETSDKIYDSDAVRGSMLRFPETSDIGGSDAPN